MRLVSSNSALLTLDSTFNNNTLLHFIGEANLVSSFFVLSSSYLVRIVSFKGLSFASPANFLSFKVITNKYILFN